MCQRWRWRCCLLHTKHTYFMCTLSIFPAKLFPPQAHFWEMESEKNEHKISYIHYTYLLYATEDTHTHTRYRYTQIERALRAYTQCYAVRIWSPFVYKKYVRWRFYEEHGWKGDRNEYTTNIHCQAVYMYTREWWHVANQCLNEKIIMPSPLLLGTSIGLVLLLSLFISYLAIY